MKPTTLRRRLYSLFLRWFVLFLLIAGSLSGFAFARIRGVAMEERRLVADTLAHYLDSTIAELFRNLRSFSTDHLVIDDRFGARLRAGRFQLIFRDAIYVLDEQARVVTSDPPAVEPISTDAGNRRERITNVLHKSGAGTAFVAIVQPLRSEGRHYTLVSEMSLRESALNAMLRELSMGSEQQLFVVDAEGTVIASRREDDLLHVVPAAAEIGEHIVGHRTFESRDSPCWTCDGDAESGYATVMVPLRYAPWGVVLQEPARQAFFAVRVFRDTLLVSLGLLVVTGVLVLAALSSSVLRPVRELSQQAESLRRGELSQPIRAEGDHEIQVLAATLDEARQRLLASFDELRALNEHLEEEVAERTREIGLLLEAALAKDAQRRSLVRRLLGAGEEERKRIARELHDEISQLLTVIQLSLQNVPGDHRELVKADHLLAKTQKELHRIMYDLRPSLLDDLGLAAAIKWYAKNYLSTRGLKVAVEVEEGLRLPAEIEISTFRIYQEIVTNILRHSQAENVSIELYSRRDKVVLAVEDDGVGFAAGDVRGGLGIVGMRERVAIVDGSIRIDSEPGMGTQVIVELPMEKAP